MFNFYKKLGPISYNDIASVLELDDSSNNHSNVIINI